MSIEFIPDDGRAHPYRRKVLSVEHIEGTSNGNYLTLDCGHRLITYGSLDLLPENGVICMECKNAATWTNKN